MTTEDKTKAAEGTEKSETSEGTEKAETTTETSEKSAPDHSAVCSAVLTAAMKSDPDNASSYEAGIASFAKAFGQDEDEEEKKKSETDTDLAAATKSMTTSDYIELSEAHARIGTFLTSVKAAGSDETEKSETTKTEKSETPDIAAIVKAAVEAAVAPVTKSIEAVAERVETVEKTRGVSNAEGDDTTPVEKSDTPKSIFSGVV